MVIVGGREYEVDPKTEAVIRAALANASKIAALERGEIRFNVCGEDVRLHVVHEFCEPVKVSR